jgi:ADP-dependent NAD(P)H-hydrate dehydratase / NAD(P)H-hydrate epimerase
LNGIDFVSDPTVGILNHFINKKNEMKIFLTKDIKETDAKTMELEGISSSGLMDRAALALFGKIVEEIDPSKKILVIAGPGNNGGDALVVARLLVEAKYDVFTILCSLNRFSSDASFQLGRLQNTPNALIKGINFANELVAFEDMDVLIDGLFGSGLNRPLEGFFADVVQWINKQKARVISIDLPSGLFGEDNVTNASDNIVKSDLVLGLQFPRLSFLFPENEKYINEWKLVDIAIHPLAIESVPSNFYFSLMEEIKPILKIRSRFSHKGTCGKGLIIAGSTGMMGAAVLSAKGALRSGIGLLSVRVPVSGLNIVQTCIPEALVQTYDSDSFYVATDTIDFQTYSAIAVGPGIGTGKDQAISLEYFLKQIPQNLILDADALNILSEHPILLDYVPKNTILTPHPKEFDRLIGNESQSGYVRLEKAIGFAKKRQVYLILKGTYTACITPDGRCFFNNTGNPGMSTGGSGDVLTGIILSLLAQGYHQEQACKLGVFLHGLSGDCALQNQSQESLIAGDIAENLGKAFKQLQK